MALTTQPKNLSTTESILDQLRNDINNFVYDEQFITEAAISIHTLPGEQNACQRGSKYALSGRDP